MLRLPCPHCGLRDQTEFSYGGDASVTRPPTETDVDDGAWADYLFSRTNPDGRHREYWHHTYGCRRWMRVTRDTRTDIVEDVDLTLPAPAEDAEP